MAVQDLIYWNEGYLKWSGLAHAIPAPDHEVKLCRKWSTKDLRTASEATYLDAVLRWQDLLSRPSGNQS